MRIKETITKDEVVLMCKQILPTSAIRNIWRTVRRTCMLILGLKGKYGQFEASYKVHEANNLYSVFYEHLTATKQIGLRSRKSAELLTLPFTRSVNAPIILRQVHFAKLKKENCL